MPTISVAKRTNPNHGSHAQQRAQFTTQHLAGSAVVVTVHGDLDAANAAVFTEYAVTHVKPGAKLVLDLSSVAFFGAACFATLHTLNVRCAGVNVDWTLVPSRAVSRVLRICDPDSGLTTAPDVTAALARKNDQRPLQLVSENA
jgi:anti-anti-sigma factor